jgi:hypothetical protein
MAELRLFHTAQQRQDEVNPATEKACFKFPSGVRAARRCPGSLQEGEYMSIQDWAAISEIVGAIAIIVSLIYVGVQLRQNTRATRVITSQAFVQTYGGVVSHLQEPEFRDIFWRGLAGLSNLHGGELAAFGAWAGHLFRTWESYYFQRKARAFEDQIWSGWNRQFRDLLGYPGVQEIWTIRRHHFSEEFRELVEREIANKESKPLYAVAEGAHV